MIRQNLEDECTECARSKADAQSIHPVTRGKYSMGPDWYCGACLKEIQDHRERPPQ